MAFHVWNGAKKSSVLYQIERSNLITVFLEAVFIYLVWNALVTATEFVIGYLSNVDLAQKVAKQLNKFGVLISLMIAMLYSETPDQFELLATLISFALIFQSLFPKGLNDLVSQIRTKAIQKWKNHENKN